METVLKEFKEKMPSRSGYPSKLKSPILIFESLFILWVVGRLAPIILFML